MPLILKILTYHLLFGLVYILAFAYYFRYSASIVLLHEILLFAVVAFFLVPGIYLSRLKNKALAKTYLLIFLPAVDTLLLFIYSSNAVANSMWSGNVTLQLIWAYAADFDVMMETLPGLRWFSVFMLALFVALIFIYKKVLAKSTNDSERDKFIGNKIAGYCALSVILIGVLIEVTFDSDDPGIWSGEPLTNLFLPYIPMFAYDSSLAGNQSRSQAISGPLATAGGTTNKNVVIIMVDALRADHLKSYGYDRDTSPFLSQQLEQGKLLQVDMVHSTCSESTCGILSVLTGNEFSDIRTNSPHIGDMLKSRGYTTNFIVTGNHAWGGLREMYNADYLSDGQSRELYSINDDAGILNDLEQLELSSAESNFFYIHLYSVHELGLRHHQFNEFRPYQSSLNPFKSLFSGDDVERETRVNKYDNGILQADYFIEQIFDQLRARNVLDNSIVIITSDHGEALGEHGHYGHVHELYEEDIRVPLYVYDSDLQSYQNTEYAAHIDILPTILDSLAIESPAQLPGKSLHEEVGDERLTFHQTTTDSGWKLNLFKRGDSIYKHMWEGMSYEERTAERLFELVSDPTESNDLSGSSMAVELINEIQNLKKQANGR